MLNGVRLLFVVTEDWYFCSHRLAIATAARKLGMQVAVATRIREHGDAIRQAGIEVLPIEWSRGGSNPFQEVKVLALLLRAYRSYRPDIVHHVAMKPVILGTAAARATGVRGVVNALAGLGYVFSSSDARARMLRVVSVLAARLALHHPRSRVIVQNPDDYAVVVERRLARPGDVRLIRGSGVDLETFSVQPQPDGVPVVVLPARMLRDKGIFEFVEAARILAARSVQVRMALVGAPDPANPASVSERQLLRWTQAGFVEWWGWHDDMRDVFRRSTIVCLPSYREGLPKALLEAAACGRPLVASDVPGCREVVQHRRTGLLVPPGDPQALATAVATLVCDRELSRTLGAEGRRVAEQEFSVEEVTRATTDLYREVLWS